MTLQSKLLLTLLSGIALVYAASQWAQHHWQSATLGRLAQANLAHEEDTQWRWVETIEKVAAAALLDAMAEGEMDKVRYLLDEQAKVNGVQEVAFYSIKGVVALSSDPAGRGKRLSPEDHATLLQQGQPVRRRTANSFEILQPMPVTTGCYECHPGFKNHRMGGVMSYRYSAAALQEAEAQWADFSATLRTQNQRSALATSVILVVFLGGLVWVIVRTQVCRPLNAVARLLNRSARQVQSASGSIAESSASLAAGATQQAASLEQTAASLSEMSGITRQNSTSAETVDRSLRAELAPKLEHIRVLAENVQRVLRESVSASARTAEVIKTIDGIAFQTNLLALNAAVEAARAGEAGLGFAVVAGEVRELAHRCAEAARNTQELVENSRSLLEKTAQEFSSVSGAVGEAASLGQRVQGLVAGISAASQEQASGVAQIDSAVSQMDTVTQSTAAAAEENAGAAKDLNREAGELTSAVDELLKLIGQRASEQAAEELSAVSNDVRTSAAAGRAPLVRTPAEVTRR